MIPQKFQMLDPISRDNNFISEVQVTFPILLPLLESFVTSRGRNVEYGFVPSVDMLRTIPQFSEKFAKRFGNLNF